MEDLIPKNPCQHATQKLLARGDKADHGPGRFQPRRGDRRLGFVLAKNEGWPLPHLDRSRPNRRGELFWMVRFVEGQQGGGRSGVQGFRAQNQGGVPGWSRLTDAGKGLGGLSFGQRHLQPQGYPAECFGSGVFKQRFGKTSLSPFLGVPGQHSDGRRGFACQKHHSPRGHLGRAGLLPSFIGGLKSKELFGGKAGEQFMV